MAKSPRSLPLDHARRAASLRPISEASGLLKVGTAPAASYLGGHLAAPRRGINKCATVRNGVVRNWMRRLTAVRAVRKESAQLPIAIIRVSSKLTTEPPNVNLCVRRSVGPARWLERTKWIDSQIHRHALKGMMSIAIPFETKIIWTGLSSCSGIPAYCQRYRAIGAFGPLAQLSKGSTRYNFLETKGHKIGLVRRGWIFARGPRR